MENVSMPWPHHVWLQIICYGVADDHHLCLFTCDRGSHFGQFINQRTLCDPCCLLTKHHNLQYIPWNMHWALLCFVLFFSLQWPHNEPTGISNHRRLDCLFNHLFKLTLKETSEPALLTLCEGNHRWPTDSPHKGLVTRKPFPFEDVIMVWLYFTSFCCVLWFISLHSSGYVFYLWLSQVLANERTHSICNVFSSFLRNAAICESWA